MKKLSIYPLFLILGLFIFLIISFCFANDIEIGNAKLTPNQLEKLPQINGSLNGVVKGISYWNDSGKVIAVTTRDLNNNEKNTLLQQVKSLSDEPLPKQKTVEERLSELENKSK